MARPGVVLLSLGLAGCESGTPARTDAQRPTAPPAAIQPAAPLPLPAQSIPASRRTAITTAVERVAPAVVTVQTETVQRVPVDPFEYFFGGRSGQRSSAGIGSGFVVRADGIIVTNAHVVSGASKISVMMRDGTTYPATLVGEDDQNDVAVLRVSARNLPVAPLGRSDDLTVGEWSIAIGNPYGFVLGNTEPSVSVGVISAIGRNLVGRGEGGGVYVDMIQTDAAINPGNSGGPLVNAAGDVIGVNSSIYTPSGGSVGLGFAIPINRARRIADDLLQHGAVRQPWVGVRLRLPDVNNVRDALAVGCVVAAITPSSPAQRAGIRVGDQLVRIGSRVLRNPFDWEASLLDLRVGESVPVQVRRDGREFTATIAIADLPDVGAQKVQVFRELELVTLTPQIRGERGVQSGAGALVYRASAQITESIGLQQGDVIVQVNRTTISAADQAAQVIEREGARGPVRVFFERGGQIFTTDFRLR
ncbi:MAG: trypsin-like peptidase domain-containing protein [Gemmatimonadaceae bacterium]|jgi:serine protease Do|nr:trypsin-like peptidase domain-containing protein [Gemmatimonadaceae bacterium]